MRFILRSAFWLCAAFLVIRPDVDLGGAVSAMSAKAMDAGAAAIASSALTPSCDTLQCAGAHALAGAITSSLSLDPPMQDSSSSPVPLPRPRPDRMG